MVKSKLFPAIATLTGTMIGAGFLAIPYVVSKSGFFVGLFWIIFIGLFIMLMKLYLGEVSLRTKGNHQLTGYAEKYLGKDWRNLMFFSMIFGIYSSLFAYLIAEGESLSYLFTGSVNYSIYFVFAFFAVMACLTYVGLRALKRFESLGLIIVIILVAAIVVYFLPSINPDNLSYINKENIFMPFGVIFFSFLAFSSLPEIERELVGQEKYMKKTIIIGTSIAILVYVLFTFAVVGYKGENVPEIATLALGKVFVILGIVTMFTAFFAGSIALRDMFRFDFHVMRWKAWLVVMLVPIVLYLINYFYSLVSFTRILGITGIISGGTTGITILLMNRAAKRMGNRKPEYSLPVGWWIIFVLSFVFVLGAVLEFAF